MRHTWTSGSVKCTARGVLACNNTPGDVMGSSSGSDDSWTSTNNGRYCWCKITQWIPDGSGAINLSASWIFDAGFSNSTDCSNGCGCAAAAFWKLQSTVFASVRQSTSTCESCPSGGTSTAGATEITQCYVPTTTDFTDAAGTYHFSSNCYYSE